MFAIIGCRALQPVWERHLRPPTQHFSGTPIIDAAAPLFAGFCRAMLRLQLTANRIA
jgi:hypothetical protein